MKIISNFKDYYDFQQSNGIDPLVTYTRLFQECDRKWDAKKKRYVDAGWLNVPVKNYFDPNYFNVGLFAICGTFHVVFMYQNAFYYGYEGYKELPSEIAIKSYFSTYTFVVSKAEHIAKLHAQKTSINDQYNCPVVLVSEIDQLTPICKNPKLSDYGIQKFITPEKIYADIWQFLTKTPDIVDNRTDVEKIKSFGFDIKTSFRKM